VSVYFFSMQDADDEHFDPALFLNQDYRDHTFTFGNISLPIQMLHSAMTDYDLTGQIVWPACYALCNYILRHQSLFQGKRVLELGSGVGLSGLLAAQFASGVTLTDGNEAVLDLLRRNAAACAPTTAAPMQCSRLQWGTSDEDSIRPEDFDMIIGADIVFWPQHVALLFHTVARALSPSNFFILSYKSRAGILDQSIEDQVELCGLVKVDIPLADYQTAPCATNLASGFTDVDIHLFRISLAPPGLPHISMPRL